MTRFCQAHIVIYTFNILIPKISIEEGDYLVVVSSDGSDPTVTGDLPQLNIDSSGLPICRWGVILYSYTNMSQLASQIDKL